MTTSSSSNPGKTAVICGVKCAACAGHRQEVVIFSYNSTDDTNQDLPVLLPQKTIDEWVTGSLGVEQAFGGNAPVTRDAHRGQQFHQPVGGRQKK